MVTGSWWFLALMLLVVPVMRARPAHASENAATQYLFAIAELSRIRLPDYVNQAAGDDPTHGLSRPLSEEQKAYLHEPSIVAVLARFDDASSRKTCDWGRFAATSWSDPGINDGLHALARLVSLRARAHYEASRWIEGNRDVERVRRLARHMTLFARPFEHQCFMVENMAMGTTAAYVLQFPQDALDDLSKRHKRLGRFSPKEPMLAAEAERIRDAVDDYKNGRINIQQLLSYIRPYLATNDEVNALVKAPREAGAGEVLGLAKFLKELSSLMDEDHQRAAERISQLYEGFSKTNQLVAGFGEPPVGEFLENAQGICRGMMVGAVVARLRQGQNEFRDIDDPYGGGNFRYRAEDSGFTLVSELTYFNDQPITSRFGLAGDNDKSSRSSTVKIRKK